MPIQIAILTFNNIVAKLQIIENMYTNKIKVFIKQNDRLDKNQNIIIYSYKVKSLLEAKQKKE